MSNAINFDNVMDMLKDSDEDFESYGLNQYTVTEASTGTIGEGPSIMLPGSEETETWYGE